MSSPRRCDYNKSVDARRKTSCGSIGDEAVIAGQILINIRQDAYMKHNCVICQSRLRFEDELIAEISNLDEEEDICLGPVILPCARCCNWQYVAVGEGDAQQIMCKQLT